MLRMVRSGEEVPDSKAKRGIEPKQRLRLRVDRCSVLEPDASLGAFGADLQHARLAAHLENLQHGEARNLRQLAPKGVDVGPALDEHGLYPSGVGPGQRSARATLHQTERNYLPRNLDPVPGSQLPLTTHGLVVHARAVGAPQVPQDRTHAVVADLGVAPRCLQRREGEIARTAPPDHPGRVPAQRHGRKWGREEERGRAPVHTPKSAGPGRGFTAPTQGEKRAPRDSPPPSLRAPSPWHGPFRRTPRAQDLRAPGAGIRGGPRSPDRSRAADGAGARRGPPRVSRESTQYRCRNTCPPSRTRGAPARRRGRPCRPRGPRTPGHRDPGPAPRECAPRRRERHPSGS